MTKATTSLFFCCLLACILSGALHAQTTTTPKDMIEVGAAAGYMFVAGDVSQKPGYGYGIHVRKATDYMFSLRFDVNGGQAKGENPSDNIARDFTMNWLSGTAYGVFSLNNFRFDRSSKKLNYYAMVGAGGNFYNTTFTSAGSDGNPRKGEIEREVAPHASVGAGISFRLNKKVNIGLEHQAFVLFGQRSDKLDGIFLENQVRSAFSDILNFTSIQVNYNIGNPSNRSEPLYWANAMEGVMADMDEVKKRTEEGLADTDQDGVIDAIDQEPNTPVDVPVDTKGRTLDSDKDGIPDYKDLEPYYPPRAGEKVNEDGVVINPINPTGGGGVTEDRVKELIDEALSDYGLNEPKNSVAEWFLPMIHFGTDSYSVKYSDYGTLASIARMLKSNDEMRLVVTGYTDQSGPEAYNENLSYQRARAIIDHLTNNHGIGRGRLVLQWKGQESALVPSTSSYMNRRVEFRMAGASDFEMDPPAGLKSGSDGY